MSEKITLESLRPADGATKKTKRVGRGRASGHGKTSCRGHNGEGQRSGRSAKRGFEGGQMPAFRRLPKLKGFRNFNALNYAEINVGDLDRLGRVEIDLAVLKELGKAHPSTEALRVLGNGDLKTKVDIKAMYFTKSAAEKIEKAGGKAQLI